MTALRSMARYFFDLDDNGDTHRDDVGVECAGLAEAKREAVSGLVDVTRDTLPDGDHHHFTMVVRDARSVVVLRVAINFDVLLQPAALDTDEQAAI